MGRGVRGPHPNVLGAYSSLYTWVIAGRLGEPYVVQESNLGQPHERQVLSLLYYHSG